MWDEGDSPYLSHDNVLSISVKQVPPCAPLEGVWLATPAVPTATPRGNCCPMVDCVCETAVLLDDQGLRDSCTELRGLESSNPNDPLCVSGAQVLGQLATDLSVAHGLDPAPSCVTLE